jgi:hypothetical protein
MLKRSIGALLLFTIVFAAAAYGQRGGGAGTLTTQDYIDIQQLYARYNNAIDAGDGEAYAGTFTPDGVFNTFTGHDALVGFIKNWRDNLNGATRRHWNTNLVITPTPDGASGTVYLFLMDLSVRPPVIGSAARYEDSLVKTGQGWRFKKRTTRGDPPPAPRPPQ